jgi:hypothetical protein
MQAPVAQPDGSYATTQTFVLKLALQNASGVRALHHGSWAVWELRVHASTAAWKLHGSC